MSVKRSSVGKIVEHPVGRIVIKSRQPVIINCLMSRMLKLDRGFWLLSSNCRTIPADINGFQSELSIAEKEKAPDFSEAFSSIYPKFAFSDD